MPLDADRVRETLLHLLRTPSFSGQEGAIAAWVTARLEELGCTVERDAAGATFGGECGNVIARLPGTVAAAPIFLNAHLDTVQPTTGLEPQVVDGLVVSGGDTILGADDKAGVTAILEGVAAVVAAGTPRPPLEIVFTVGEETGLHGARALDLSALQATCGFVFDSGTPIGELTISAPTQASQRIVLTGRAAHAGVEPELGINAIACAAAAIAACRQGRLDAETTANIGVIEGGQATNIVPEVCRLRSEVRSRDQGKLEAQVAHFQETFQRVADEFGCALEFSSREAYRGFRIDLAEPVARLAAAAVRAAGLQPSWAEGGGGSDANVFNAGGKRCILLACGERDPHTLRESCALADVVAAAEVVAALLGVAAGERV
ncbi:MAG: M20/M25/M40 family metallo-hydrolase [Fimbriimonadaceae bacterium]|nr:M20/M25/M40 family metallo-hydrolase [Fimbriimonadaceae bacterium]